MASLWLREFTGGLDTRRLPETSAGGSLTRGQDGHVTRGGEFEKRAAFVPTYTLPAGTVNLAATPFGLVVFGSAAAPATPVGVTYQRLQPPSPGPTLVNVPSWELYAGKVYAVGEFSDGSRHHFYDGTRVDGWFDGRARASFAVTDGSPIAAVAASGSFEVFAGTLGAGNQITSVRIDGVDILTGPVAHTGSNATTAAAIANAVNSLTSSPDYTATVSGQTVTVTAVATGPLPNGKAIVIVVGGNALVGNTTIMAGGANASASSVTVFVDGVQVMAAPVAWAASHAATAAAVAQAINNMTSAPDYTATAVGNVVNVTAATNGETPNGKPVTFALTGDFGVAPSAGLVLANGATPAGTFTPGTFVKTIGSRMTSTSGPTAHGSGLGSPTKWTTDATGAFFIDMSTQAAGSEALTALAVYQNTVAVFAERVIQIWSFTADPANNAIKQVLRNNGTASPRSVTDFGDNDLFFLDESGVRSLRARDSSNAAATSDIGVPVDTLITEKLRALENADRKRVIGLIEPRDGRFWLCMLNTIFVFSYFPGAKVSAWTTYEPGHFVDGVYTPITVSDAAVYDRRVYVRSGDTIFAYGGTGAALAYDATPAEVWTPYLDANAPTTPKTFEGLDVALTGEWEVSVAFDPNNEDASDKVARLFRTTFPGERIPLNHSATHISLRLKTTRATAAKLGAIVVTYDSAKDAPNAG